MDIKIVEPNKNNLKKIYYWKFLEEKQEAKKWNGPYIEELKLAEEKYINMILKKDKLDEKIFQDMIIEFQEKPIGTLNAHWFDEKAKALEIGIVLYDSNLWGLKIGSLVFKEWINMLFEKTSANRIGISTWSGNYRMIKLAKKLNMKEEAKIREARIVNGEYYDAIKMGILKKEWKDFLKNTH
ncbi:GNAT family N-acetyltransferase [Staphylococcus hominis]|jgi:RimJ/RimL family protein N-acetyltransferase|uniref:GNAT family N-acetyltransferase n=1 Tax=Staphylococcus hominis TaxID=1290 RepID=UPI0012AB2C35|nr:GNAT family protein [Staphylococcus hominis]MCC3712398.1 GNAT family N-acetyltransferase [Staphylococcus hominis]MCC3714520.1 GNAT family N-acetyltransferase [Staphylococcus hominis]MCC3738231.1 GNAT family N-acetyltransferase [Staphylococcus hominis]